MASSTEKSQPLHVEHDARVTPQAKMMLAMLLAIYTCSFVDRYIMALLIEPLRHEFDLSDSQLGLMSNTVFGIAYAVVGIPMGLLVDRVNRTKLIAATLTIWSVLTALSAGVGSFVAMLIVRAGVGASESAVAPASYSLIADTFPKSRRSTATGIFFAAAPLGMFISFAGGGYIVAHWGWRAAFLVAGLPGILLAIMAFWMMKEPRRGAYDVVTADAPAAAPVSLGTVLRFIGANPLLLSLMTATIFTAMAGATLTAWTASYFIRLHDMPLQTAGFMIATIGGAGIIIGTVGNGWLADRMAVRDVRWPLWLAASCALLTFVTGTVMAYAAFIPLAALGMFLSKGFGVAYVGPTFSSVLNNAPPNMRGTIMSVHQVMMNLVGFGMGPILTGVISDAFGGGEGLRPAIVATLMLNIPAAILMLIAARLVHKQHLAAQQTAM